MQFEKRQVRLGDIRPSEQNPREDFGDIGALARSIEATGGEPLNPPVVVADGNVYRIVDGERRYRALSSIYGEDREVSALVADTMDEATRTRSASVPYATSLPATSRRASQTSTRPAAGSWRRPRTWPSSTTAGAATTRRRGSTTMTLLLRGLRARRGGRVAHGEGAGEFQGGEG